MCIVTVAGANPYTWDMALFDVAEDGLRDDLQDMLSMLETMQHAEYSHKLFPYIPRCILYACAL